MQALKENGPDLYLYPIHRLDRPVSGPVIFGLSKMATRVIKEKWNSDEVVKKYLTLCRGQLEEEGRWDFSLKNEKRFYQPALTLYRPLDFFQVPELACTLVEVQIKTGRRHQIRRHFSRRFYNLLGDTRYGKGAENLIYRTLYHLERIFLHCHYLKLPHPIENRWIEVEVPLAPDLQKVIDKISKFKS
jgi:23S rRNA-/tRNA-specific pseudouridylate synthase